MDAATAREVVTELLFSHCFAWARTSHCHRACSHLIRQIPIDLDDIRT
jgi:hypothetical protein